MNLPLFTDSSYLIAIINPRDQLREIALRVKSEIGEARLVVTESILVETLNYFSEFNPNAKRHALKTVEDLLLNQRVEIVEQSNAVFHDGMKFYGERLDKGYSLTDCISMNICRERGIAEILTNDHHFEQEGFRVLL
jgi:uncharacterized protein